MESVSRLDGSGGRKGKDESERNGGKDDGEMERARCS
jgi:hypothetical protein